MAPDTAIDDLYATLRMHLAKRLRAEPAPAPTSIEPLVVIDPGPCEDCTHWARCRAREACERFAVWVAWGRDSDGF